MKNSTEMIERIVPIVVITSAAKHLSSPGLRFFGYKNMTN